MKVNNRLDGVPRGRSSATRRRFGELHSWQVSIRLIIKMETLGIPTGKKKIKRKSWARASKLKGESQRKRDSKRLNAKTCQWEKLLMMDGHSKNIIDLPKIKFGSHGPVVSYLCSLAPWGHSHEKGVTEAVIRVIACKWGNL